MPTISFSLNRPTESFAQSECNEQTKEQMNIKVFCRFRPTFKTPASLKYDSTMIEDGENSYSFDHIFGKYSAQ